MWQSLRNANPQVKAALIAGIFLLIATIIAGLFQLIKLEIGSSSPTPTPIGTTIVSITPSPTSSPTPSPTPSTPLKTLQTLCSAAKNLNYQTQWDQFSSTFRINEWGSESMFANDLMQKDSSYSGIKDCTVTNVMGNSGTTNKIYNDGSVDTNVFGLVLDSDGVWRINAILKHSGV